MCLSEFITLCNYNVWQYYLCADESMNHIHIGMMWVTSVWIFFLLYRRLYFWTLQKEQECFVQSVSKHMQTHTKYIECTHTSHYSVHLPIIVPIADLELLALALTRWAAAMLATLQKKRDLFPVNVAATAKGTDVLAVLEPSWQSAWKDGDHVWRRHSKTFMERYVRKHHVLK